MYASSLQYCVHQFTSITKQKPLSKLQINRISINSIDQDAIKDIKTLTSNNQNQKKKKIQKTRFKKLINTH